MPRATPRAPLPPAKTPNGVDNHGSWPLNKREDQSQPATLLNARPRPPPRTSFKKILIHGTKTTLFQTLAWTTTSLPLIRMPPPPRTTAPERTPDAVNHGRLLPRRHPFLHAILLNARPRLLPRRSSRRIPIHGIKTTSSPTSELIMTSLTPTTMLPRRRHPAKEESAANHGK